MSYPDDLPRRVLFVHQSSELYGSDRMLLTVAAWLQARGCEAIVVLPGGGPLVAALRGRSIETHEVEEGDVLKLSRRAMSLRGVAGLVTAMASSLRVIDRCVAGRQVDLVYSNTLAVLGGAWWARRRGRRHLWHVHEIVEAPAVVSQMLAAWVQWGADTVVCNSGATWRWLTGVRPRLAGRATVVWNGIDPTGIDVPEIEAMRSAFRVSGAMVVVGLVGRIINGKGQDLLLRAMEMVLAEGRRRCALVFIGDAPVWQSEYARKLRERVASSPIAGQIVWPGFLPDTATAYAALDIVCVPSLVAESFGLVAIEAMAACRPVVAADIGGLAEVVVDGQTGWLHPPGDASTLARRLGALIDDAQARRAMGECGRRRYEAEFTADAMGRRLAAVLSGLPMGVGR